MGAGRARRPCGLLLAALVGTEIAAGCASGGLPAQATFGRLPERPAALVQMRRAGCASGGCPAYGLSIFADRTVVYDGAANVPVTGERRAVITPEQLRALQLSIETTHFLDSTDECCVCPDQRPKRYVVLDYRPGLIHKTVVHDPDCAAAPSAITALERLIDGMTGAARWTSRDATAATTPPPPITGDMLIPESDGRHEEPLSSLAPDAAP
jgi:hypothetical protein